MTTLDLHGPHVSGFSLGGFAANVFGSLWSAFVDARMRRAAVLASFYSAK